MNHEAERALDGYLIALIRGGSRDAFDQLVRRWTPKLVRYATRVLGRPEVARDVAQETWIGVIRGLKRLDDPSQFPAWVCSIAHKKCIDGMRGNQRERRLIESVRSEAAVAAESNQTGLGTVAGADLAMFISQLSQDQREVVHLFYGEDLSIDDIAMVVGAPAGTVKSRLHHARQSLKKCLGE